MLRILPVVHFLDHETSVRNAELALGLGADGVFLIHMAGQDDLLDETALVLKTMFPERFVGTNRLRMSPVEAVERDAALGLDGTWHDSPGINTRRMGDLAPVDAAFARARAANPAFAFFASVAFKYQAEEPDPARAARMAADRGWIATTSGRATGVPADVAKLSAMRAALGGAPLGIASGVDPQNIGSHLPFVTHVLVSTGVSRDEHNFDRRKLADLLRAAGKGG